MIKLIKQNDKNYNLCDVFLIPTNKEIKENDLVLIEKVFNYNLVSKNNTSLSESEIFRTNLLTIISRIDMKHNGIWCEEGYHITDLVEAGLVKPMNLYFTSDEEIKVGDRYLCNGKYVYWYERNDILSGDCKKIIATTDSSLKKPVSGRSGQPCPLGLVDDDGLTYKSFPKPSNDFINEYVGRDNIGTYITKVLVEYEGGTKTTIVPVGYDDYCTATEFSPIKLKVNGDNTINIVNQKESWTREEVIALHKLNCERLTNSYISSDIDWIEENL